MNKLPSLPLGKLRTIAAAIVAVSDPVELADRWNISPKQVLEIANTLERIANACHVKPGPARRRTVA